MALDKHGVVSVVQIILYAPILVIAALLVMRHGASRKAGWIGLATLCLGMCSHFTLSIMQPDDKCVSI